MSECSIRLPYKKKSQFILPLETIHGNRKFQKFVKVVVGNFHLMNI